MILHSHTSNNDFHAVAIWTLLIFGWASLVLIWRLRCHLLFRFYQRSLWETRSSKYMYVCMYYGLLLLLLHFSNSRVMFPDRVESKNCKHCLFSRKSPLSFPTTTTYCILLNGLYFYWVTLTNYTKINAGTIHGMNTREMEFICLNSLMEMCKVQLKSNVDFQFLVFFI